MEEASEVLDISLPCDEYDTFNGLIFGALGSIPQDGTSVEVETDGLAIKVTQISDHQVEEAIVCKISPEAEDSATAANA